MWPFRAVERFEGPFDSTLKNTIIIATNTIDPVTPKKNAQKVADLLGDSAQLVEQRGYGVRPSTHMFSMQEIHYRFSTLLLQSILSA